MCIIHKWEEFGPAYRYCQKCKIVQRWTSKDLWRYNTSWIGWKRPLPGVFATELREWLENQQYILSQQKTRRDLATHMSTQANFSYRITLIERPMSRAKDILKILDIDVYQKVSK